MWQESAWTECSAGDAESFDHNSHWGPRSSDQHQSCGSLQGLGQPDGVQHRQNQVIHLGGSCYYLWHSYDLLRGSCDFLWCNCDLATTSFDVDITSCEVAMISSEAAVTFCDIAMSFYYVSVTYCDVTRVVGGAQRLVCVTNTENCLSGTCFAFSACGTCLQGRLPCHDI